MVEEILLRKFDFIGIGTQKAGSTALWKYLLKHPDVADVANEAYGDYLTDAKEPNLFNVDNISKKATKLVELYNKVPYDKLLGEFTVHYIDNVHDALRRIRRHNNNIKVICILRDPSARTYSAYNWVYNPLNKPEWREPFEKFLTPDQIQRSDFINKSKVGLKVKHALEVFEPNQIKFIKYETFTANQEEVVKDVLNFLGLDLKKYTYEFAEINKRSYINNIYPEHRERLVEYYMEDILEVERLLGWDCSDWKK